MTKKYKQIMLVTAIIIGAINITPIFSAVQSDIDNNFVVYSNQLKMSLTDDEYVIDYTKQTFNEQLGIVDSTDDITSDQQVIRAMSNSEYPITPGDIFVLTYKASNELVTYNVQIDGKYNLDIPGFDTLNVKGFNFSQLKAAIIDLIEQYYPYATTRLFLNSTGNFIVTVKGEVSSTTEISCWGLSRLSDVTTVATKYASSRAVKVTSKDGSVKTYDLYAALKKGDLTQNPLMKSGDVVTFEKASRIITIDGEVYQPGTYQLVKGENLTDLIEDYAGGFLNSADKSKINISRYSSETGKFENLEESFDSNLSLLNQDTVTVNSVRKVYNSIAVEGAITSNSNVNSNTSSTILGMAAGKLIYYFIPGERLSQAVEGISSRFTSSSDLENSYIIRDGKKIKVNIQQLLNGDLSQDVILLPSDTLLIPFDQKFVNVQGAVNNASSYAYAPDKTVNYYIALSGGVTDYATGTIKVFDKNGNRVDSDDFVPSESTIVVVKSNFAKNLSTTVTIIGLVYTTTLIVENIQSIF
jgi:protein involved in polysaccharide export with SLBB domain